MTSDYLYSRDLAKLWLDSRLFRIYDYFRLKHLFSYVSASKPPSVLDFGCNTGRIAKKLSLILPNSTVVGYDPNPALRGKVIEGLSFFDDLADIDNKYELIVVFNVLEYVGSLEATIDQIKGVIKKGGRLYLGINNMRHPLNTNHLLRALVSGRSRKTLVYEEARNQYHHQYVYDLLFDKGFSTVFSGHDYFNMNKLSLMEANF